MFGLFFGGASSWGFIFMTFWTPHFDGKFCLLLRLRLLMASFRPNWLRFLRSVPGHRVRVCFCLWSLPSNCRMSLFSFHLCLSYFISFHDIICFSLLLFLYWSSWDRPGTVPGPSQDPSAMLMALTGHIRKEKRKKQRKK